MVPPKVSILELMGRLKGRSAIRILNKHPKLRKKRYWGKSFLGAWLLRRHGRSGCRDDQALRAVSRAAREESGTVAT